MGLNKDKIKDSNLIKINIISAILTFGMLIVSLFLLFVSPYYFYGWLFGTIFLFLSLILIDLVHKYFSFKKHTYIFVFSVFAVRTILFITALLLMFLVINDGSGEAITQVTKPIDFFIFLIVYLFYNISSVLVIVFDKILM